LQPYTGHLIKLKNEYPILPGYLPVPNELQGAAEKKLAGKDEAFVSLTSGGKLSKWAAKQRKHKRKIARASKKRNRY
jgi:hypothetical protein